MASAMMNGVRLLCGGAVGTVFEEQVITLQVLTLTCCKLSQPYTAG